MQIKSLDKPVFVHRESFSRCHVCRFWYFWQRVEERHVKRLNNQEVLIIHEVLFSSFFLQHTKINPPSQIHSAYKGWGPPQMKHHKPHRSSFSWIYLCIHSVYKLGKENSIRFKWNHLRVYSPLFFILENPAKCVFPINSQKKCVSEITWWMVSHYKGV